MSRIEKIEQIAKKYFIISNEVEALIQDLKSCDEFEVAYLIDQFLQKRPLLTTAERNFLNTVHAQFQLITIK